MNELRACDARLARWFAVFLALGLYLTFHGYHSRDGDQAYRLPLLLHRQIPFLFANDPFVRAFDDFNPHRGYLALLDAASRPLGLSAALVVLFAATFAATCLAIARMARLCWPGAGERIGVVAVAMVLVAKAGNIGTNHLFEAMLLDRLLAMALGWAALADLLEDSPRSGRAAGLLGLAALIHPSLGLQMGMLAATGWVGWAILKARTEVGVGRAARGLAWLVLAMIPGVGLMAGSGSRLLEGLPAEEFLTLSALIQSPQHMVPHLWRMPQWLAWGCYPTLALVAVRADRGGNPSVARGRLVVLLTINLVALGMAWAAIEIVGSVRATVFQPFRMATVARGLCLVLAADRVAGLWGRGEAWGRIRAALLVVGLVGDWALVVATAVEIVAGLAERFGKPAERLVGGAVLVWGLIFLSRHDTESGHWPLLGAAGIAWIIPRVLEFFRGVGIARHRDDRWAEPTVSSPNRLDRRKIAFGVLCWLVPMMALIAPGPWAKHCRFGETPTDDVERLAMWCRDHTPEGARFVGPPGPKTFRLWAHRDVAFNRAAGPYHAAGLADWASRFRDHVGFHGSISEFAGAYLKDRQGLERQYDEMGEGDLADLAHRQGADHVIAKAPGASDDRPDHELELIRVEGRYAAYRVRSPARIAGRDRADGVTPSR